MNFLTNAIIIDVISVVFLIAADENVSPACITPQYLLFGGGDLVQCSFEKGFHGVYWYNSTNSHSTLPFLVYEDSEKSGDGYFSGEFDVYPNGSLVINNVSLRHDHYFRVIMLHTPEDEAAIYDIRVLVIVRSKQNHPVIDVCGKKPFCFTSLQKHSEISCVLNGTRPATNLTLILQNASNKSIVSSDVSVTSKGPLFSTKIKTQLDFEVSSSLEVLICEVSSHFNVTSVKNSKVFLEDTKDDYTSKSPEIRHVRRGTQLTLNCSGNGKTFVVWKKRLSPDKWDTIASAYYLEKEYSNINDRSYGMEGEGTLIVNYADVEHEGTYLCIHGIQKNGEVQTFEVLVFVVPESPGIVVTGCEHDSRCILDVKREGNLTCTVKGIRPKVKLQWLPSIEETSQDISFLHNEETITENGDTYDVSLRSHYKLEKNSGTRTGVECRVIGWDNEIHQLVKIVELHFITDGDETTSTAPSRVPLYVGIPLAVIFTIAITTIVIIILRKKGGKKNGYDVHNEGSENIKMDEQEKFLKKPKMKVKKGKKTLFERELSSYYEKLYKVNPVPIIPGERNYVNAFFVQRPLEFSHPSSSQESPMQLQSHHEIFQEKYAKSANLLILKGDHGYGKSTLSLQLAYEWCNKERSSTYMNNYEIFILLHMKKVNSGNSLSQAIKSILPENTRLEVGDIENIIGSYSSGLVVLDDFNGFEGAEEEVSDFEKMIKKEIFPQFQIMLLPTPEYNSTDIDLDAPQFFLKKLDEEYQHKYTAKNVKGGFPDFDEKMRKSFQDNPLLDELCELPLFFSLYIHISLQENKIVDSVQSLFKKMMILSSEEKYGKSMNRDEANVEEKLSQIAFESLVREESEERWEATRLSRELGEGVFDYFKDIGLLVSDVVSSRQERIKFRHRLLFEWYVVLHSDIIDTIATTTLPNLSKHAVCLACALHPKSVEKGIDNIIIKQNVEKGFAMIYLELLKVGFLSEEYMKNVYEKSTVSFAASDTKREQASALMALELASKNGGKIKGIKLKNCLKFHGCTQEYLLLESGVKIPRFETLESLELEITDQKLKDTGANQMWDYVDSCKMIKTLRFSSHFLGEDFTKHMLQKFDTGKMSVQWKFCNEKMWNLNFCEKRWELISDEARVLVPGRYDENHEYLQEKPGQKYWGKDK